MFKKAIFGLVFLAVLGTSTFVGHIDLSSRSSALCLLRRRLHL